MTVQYGGPEDDGSGTVKDTNMTPRDNRLAV
jgi:hypothetical protein